MNKSVILIFLGMLVASRAYSFHAAGGHRNMKSAQEGSRYLQEVDDFPEFDPVDVDGWEDMTKED